jgi:hypothetical protein
MSPPCETGLGGADDGAHPIGGGAQRVELQVRIAIGRRRLAVA